MHRFPAAPIAAVFHRSAVLRAMACFGVVGLLSACAGGQRISGSQEAAQYEQGARGSYAAPGSQSDPWGPYIHEASGRYDVPEQWIREVMRVESGGRTEMNGRPITSGAGAMGLMQVMPATYDELRRRYSLGGDPYDPHNSILAGAAYIRELYDLYGSPGFLAAYNSGPGRLDDYLTRNRPLPEETRRYVAKIGPRIAGVYPDKRATSEVYAMNTLPTNIPAGPRYAVPATVQAVPAPPPAQPPVEVAFAPPSDSDGAFDPPPGWSPRAMPRAEANAYVPPPSAPPPVYRPAPVNVADNAPVAGYAPAPMPSRRAEADYPLPPVASEPPVQARFAARSESLPLPPPPAPVATVQTASNYGYPPPTLARHDQGMHLVSAANAAPSPVYHGSPGQWAIQVGAFGNEGLAHLAVGAAREQAGAVLSGAHPAVAGVREPHGTLYRARLTGLSREAALQACERLRGRSSCIVVSPDSAS